MPHDHQHVLADWHAADAAHVQQAIDGREGRAAGVGELGVA